MYIDEEVHELRRIEAVSIPVDFHIVEITNRLSGGAAEFNRFNEDVIVSLYGSYTNGLVRESRAVECPGVISGFAFSERPTQQYQTPRYRARHRSRDKCEHDRELSQADHPRPIDRHYI